MTTQEWLEKTLADAPPLTQGQIAVLRPVFAHVTPHMRTAPAAEAGAAAMQLPNPREERINDYPR